MKLINVKEATKRSGAVAVGAEAATGLRHSARYLMAEGSGTAAAAADHSGTADGGASVTVRRCLHIVYLSVEVNGEIRDSGLEFPFKRKLAAIRR